MIAAVLIVAELLNLWWAWLHPPTTQDLGEFAKWSFMVGMYFGSAVGIATYLFLQGLAAWVCACPRRCAE